MPSTHPRPASDGATDFLPASDLAPPTGLATSRRRRRAMRSTDFCHPNELRALAPHAFPARSRSSRCGDAPRCLRHHVAVPGDRTFHDIRDRFGGSPPSASSQHRCLAVRVMSVGVLSPRRRDDRASGTLVATPRSPSRLTRLRVVLQSRRPSFSRRVRTGRRMREAAKTALDAPP